MVTTLPLDSFHLAHLEAGAGYGLLVCPDPRSDVWLGGESVHAAAWVEAVTVLESLGWQPRRVGSGLLSCLGRNDAGRLVIEIEASDGGRTVGEDAWHMLCDAAGLVDEHQYRRA